MRKNGSKSHEGVFRLNGSKLLIKELKNQLDQGKVNDWSRFDVDVVACTLKCYFQDNLQKRPLFPDFLFFEMIKAATCEDEVFIHKVKTWFSSFSKPLYESIFLLFEFLDEIISHSDENKMSVSNISKMFANVLMYHHEINETDLPTIQKKVVFIEKILINRNVIFGNHHFCEIYVLSDEEIPLIIKRPIDLSIEYPIISKRLMQKDSLVPFIPWDLLSSNTFRWPSVD